MGKPLSWKWKLVLATIVLSLTALWYVFTDGCQNAVVGRISQEYNSMPESEQRDSAWASRWLYWAAFKGSVCGEYKVACSMLKEFCGMPKDYNMRTWDYVNSPQFKRNDSKNAFQGKCSPNGMTGWGPTHPDAPDAFYDYVCYQEPYQAGATTGREAKVYYLLFYVWHAKHSADGKPHPKFMKYWDKMRQKALDTKVGWGDIPNFDYEAKKAAPWKEPQ